MTLSIKKVMRKANACWSIDNLVGAKHKKEVAYNVNQSANDKKRLANDVLHLV